MLVEFKLKDTSRRVTLDVWDVVSIEEKIGMPEFSTVGTKAPSYAEIQLRQTGRIFVIDEPYVDVVEKINKVKTFSALPALPPLEYGTAKDVMP